MNMVMTAPIPTDSQPTSSTSHWIDITYAVEEALKETPR